MELHRNWSKQAPKRPGVYKVVDPKHVLFEIADLHTRSIMLIEENGVLAVMLDDVTSRHPAARILRSPRNYDVFWYGPVDTALPEELLFGDIDELISQAEKEE